MLQSLFIYPKPQTKSHVFYTVILNHLILVKFQDHFPSFGSLFSSIQHWRLPCGHSYAMPSHYWGTSKGTPPIRCIPRRPEVWAPVLGHTVHRGEPQLHHCTPTDGKRHSHLADPSCRHTPYPSHTKDGRSRLVLCGCNMSRPISHW